MHILTKFLVIFAALLGILLSGLSVAYTSNAERLREEIAKAQSLSKALEAQQAAEQAASAREREQLDAQIGELQSRITQLNQQMTQYQGENAELTTRVRQATLTNTTFQSRIDQFQALIETFAKLDEARSQELSELRDKELRAAHREIELGDRINDLAGQLDVSRENNRTLQEQLQVALDDVEMLKGGGSTDIAEGRRRMPPPTYRGRITGLMEDVDGTVLASVSGGSSDNLRENMEFNVVRPRQGFVAKLVLVRVDLNESVGRIDYLGREGEMSVLPNDLILPPNAN